MTNTDARASKLWRDTYAFVHQDVGNFFFDTARLADWDSWKNRFDAQISDEASARRCISLMVDSLGDPYTRVALPEEAAQKKAEIEAVLAGSQRLVSGTPLANGVGLVSIKSLSHPDMHRLLGAELVKVSNSKTLVFDLRGNTGGDLQATMYCCELLIPEGLVSSDDSRGIEGIVRHDFILEPDALLSRATLADGSIKEKRRQRKECMPGERDVVLLVDGGTASAAEIFGSAVVTSARKRTRGAIVGVQTYGKGIGQQLLGYRNIDVWITSSRFYGADGRWFGDCGVTTANGMLPDYLVEGFDEQTDAAIQLFAA